MILNNKYIYNSFTTFTKQLFNIKHDCKCCKYEKLPLLFIQSVSYPNLVPKSYLHCSLVQITVIELIAKFHLQHLQHLHFPTYIFATKKNNNEKRSKTTTTI